MLVDLIIKNAKVFQTQRKQFLKKEVAIHEGKIYYVANELPNSLQAKEVLDAKGKYMVPGLIDCHMHIESSMTTPENFSEKVLNYGVTTVIADAHEIGNVFGLEGLNYFMSAQTTLDIFHAIPSSVPSTTPELETTGGIIDVAAVETLLAHPKVICLGEGMNFKGISYEPESLIRQIIKTCQEKRPTMPLEGHCPKVSGLELADFLSSGITSDHTHQFPETMLERIEAGMFIQLQKKSLTKENISVIVENEFYDYVSLITDDVMADELLQGHLDQNIRLAIQMGLPVEWAIYITTYTPAQRMGLHDRGQLAPGKLADFILLSELSQFTISAVYKNGQNIADKAKDRGTKKALVTQYPAAFYQSVNARQLTASDLDLLVDTTKENVTCHVITKQTIGTFTQLSEKELAVIDGKLDWENSECSLLIVMERYGKNRQIAYGLVDQALIEKGAIGTTWAHDHHNIMLLGNTKQDILNVQHRLLDLQGGYVTSRDGEITAQCPLPLGGIISEAPLDILGAQLKEVREQMQLLGYQNANEIMSFSTLSLPVSPAFKITDFGVMATQEQRFIPLVKESEGQLTNARTY